MFFRVSTYFHSLSWAEEDDSSGVSPLSMFLRRPNHQLPQMCNLPNFTSEFRFHPSTSLSSDSTYHRTRSGHQSQAYNGVRPVHSRCLQTSMFTRRDFSCLVLGLPHLIVDVFQGVYVLSFTLVDRGRDDFSENKQPTNQHKLQSTHLHTRVQISPFDFSLQTVHFTEQGVDSSPRPTTAFIRAPDIYVHKAGLSLSPDTCAHHSSDRSSHAKLLISFRMSLYCHSFTYRDSLQHHHLPKGEPLHCQGHYNFHPRARA